MGSPLTYFYSLITIYNLNKLYNIIYIYIYNCVNRFSGYVFNKINGFYLIIQLL